MATLIELVRRGELHLVDPGLGPREFPERKLYVTNELLRWIEDHLYEMESAMGVEQAPTEQFDDLTYSFVRGDRIPVDKFFKCLRPSDRGVWELKTVDLRLFGWFHSKDCFIATHCDCATKIKNHGLYAGYRDASVTKRDAIDLDEPKFVNGSDADDVVSDSY